MTIQTAVTATPLPRAKRLSGKSCRGRPTSRWGQALRNEEIRRVVPVDSHGAQINLYELGNGEIALIPNYTCDSLGVLWGGQYSVARKYDRSFRRAKILTQVGVRSVIFLALPDALLWLKGIRPARVRAELRNVLPKIHKSIEDTAKRAFGLETTKSSGETPQTAYLPPQGPAMSTNPNRSAASVVRSPDEVQRFLDQDHVVDRYYAELEWLRDRPLGEQRGSFPLVFSQYKLAWEELKRVASGCRVSIDHPTPEEMAATFEGANTDGDDGDTPNGMVAVEGFVFRTNWDDRLPRIRDVDLAKKLEFARPRDIRRLIQKYDTELQKYGPVLLARRTARQLVNGGGTREYEVDEAWLNEQQALFIIVKSDTARATEVTHLCVRAFFMLREILKNGGTSPATQAGFTPEALATVISAIVTKAVAEVKAALVRIFEQRDERLTAVENRASFRLIDNTTGFYTATQAALMTGLTEYVRQDMPHIKNPVRHAARLLGERAKLLRIRPGTKGSPHDPPLDLYEYEALATYGRKFNPTHNGQNELGDDETEIEHWRYTRLAIEKVWDSFTAEGLLPARPRAESNATNSTS